MKPRCRVIRWQARPRFELLPWGGLYNRYQALTAGAVLVDGVVISFPKGWVTDITSSPWWAYSIIAQTGPHAPAALLHDRLLELGYARSYARSVMAMQLRLLVRVHPVHRALMIAGVWLHDARLALSLTGRS